MMNRVYVVPKSEETAVPQTFLYLASLTIHLSSMSWGLMKVIEIHAARTLSRGFWQQKNFHPHPLRVSSALVRTGLCANRLPLIRGSSNPRAPSASPLMVNELMRGAVQHGARESATGKIRRLHAKLRLQQIVHSLRIGFAAG
jgi:hypothetical protein